MESSSCRLITMPHSHYCEKARWALDLARVPYIEEPHLPLIHRVYTASQRGKSVPVLVTGTQVYTGSAEIVRFAHAAAPSAGLLPQDAEQRLAALSLQSYFDSELGPATRTWAYFHLQQVPSVLQRHASRGVPGWERRVARLVMSGATRLIRHAYDVNAESAHRALQRIWHIFEEVERALFRKNTLVVGGQITVADITFAALASPVLLPVGCGAAIPSDAEIPEHTLLEVQRFRRSRAGMYVLRLYETARHRSSLRPTCLEAAVR